MTKRQQDALLRNRRPTRQIRLDQEMKIDAAYYSSKEYLLKKWSGWSQQERDHKRAEIDKLRRLHSLTNRGSTGGYYKRQLTVLDESEKEIVIRGV